MSSKWTPVCSTSAASSSSNETVGSSRTTAGEVIIVLFGGERVRIGRRKPEMFPRVFGTWHGWSQERNWLQC